MQRKEAYLCKNFTAELQRMTTSLYAYFEKIGVSHILCNGAQFAYVMHMPRLPEPQRWWTVPSPGAPAFPSGDELFTHLDGRFVRVGSIGWRVEIYSVWAEDMRWVQLSLRGPSEHMLVLRVPLAANAAEILGEIEQWLRNPASVDSVCGTAPCSPGTAPGTPVPGVH